MIKIIYFVKIVKFASGILWNLDLDLDFIFHRPKITEFHDISSWFTLVFFRISQSILKTDKLLMKKAPSWNRNYS